ncbi:related to PEP12 syntaxin (T-SNARE), vacuolar [Melanopsichium pennsylvanicum]|uniref:Related to PEP12 syntaxin (t-SNARE), vacuolar n=2 Tax=Melanopsichium pennsylvanicum TaxID=63383 RepID=A0AAJ4XJH7_9BASI|nr:related to PEP12 syntaxin (T-SNARE), vacuolar [Melanopsichium pennsylvanicum 4]SNX83512.1 related to PEP12 syntaxin (T-SNARE), vacuolar [Melanopsichium pennsylvanicum]
MSFNDLAGASSRNDGGGGSSNGSRKTPLPLYRDEVTSSSSLPPEFDALTKRIGLQIFKINSNVTAIQKLVKLSSSNTLQDWSKRINDLIETTRQLVKDATTDIKNLSTFPLGPMSSSGGAKLTQGKLQRDFQSAAMAFQRVQKEAVVKTRAKLEADKQKERQMLKSAHRSITSSTQTQPPPPQQQQQQMLIDTEESSHRTYDAAESQEVLDLELLPEGPTQADLEYQESLITSREAEIREIESGVQELNEIFRDLGNIVQEQGGMIDNIEFNINNIAENTSGADRELVVAHEYQRKAGRRCIVLLLVIGFVISVVLVAILN